MEPHDRQRAIADNLRAASALLERAADELSPAIERAAAILVEALKDGRRLFLAGNGGSAADAEHLAGELVGRFQAERRPLPAMTLGADLGVLTALSNDYGYEEAYARHLEGLAGEGDVLIVLSTSGASANLIQLLRRAGELKLRSIGLLGRGGGACAALVDLAIVVPSDEVPRIQEAHLAIGHSLCAAVDEAFLASSRRRASKKPHRSALRSENRRAR